MDLDRLRGYLVFARTLNFSAAARQINVSQPALHAQVKQLEAELGVALYARDAGRLVLTEQGRALLMFGQNLLDEVGRFEAGLRGEKPSEELRLGAGLTATLYLLPGPLREFRARWPEAECRLGVHHRADVLALLRSAELDLGVTSVERCPDDMKAFVCARTRHALIVPAGHALVRARRITLADIAEHPLVLPRAGLQHRRMIDDAFRSAGVDYRAALETEGWEVMKHYVALGFGIAIVNDLCLAHSVPPEIVSRPLADLFPERVYRAIWARKRQLPEPAVRFLALLREGVGGQEERRQASGVRRQGRKIPIADPRPVRRRRLTPDG